MSRVITFSRVFPAYHPKKGQETNFVFKLWNSVGNTNPELMAYGERYFDLFPWDRSNHEFLADMIPKHHTIRAGNRWKVGDKFSPRIWSGKPYQSPQITIAPDIEIKKTWKFVCTGAYFYLNDKQIDVTSSDIPSNDGLSSDNFLDWFPERNSFEGQIICWNESINY